jgi:putative oxidoreductase
MSETRTAATFWTKLLESNAPRATILIRLVVGEVFLSESLQKFIYPEDLGTGRFAKIGIPSPEVLGPFVGVTEIVAAL